MSPQSCPGQHSTKLALLPAAEFCPVGGKCSRSAPSGAGSQGTGLSCPLLPRAGLRGHHRGSPRKRFMSLGSCRWARWGSEVRAFRVSGWSRDSSLLGPGASSCCCGRRVLLPQGSGSGEAPSGAAQGLARSGAWRRLLAPPVLVLFLLRWSVSLLRSSGDLGGERRWDACAGSTGDHWCPWVPAVRPVCRPGLVLTCPVDSGSPLRGVFS